MTVANTILNIMLTNHVLIPCAVSCCQFDLVLLGKWDTVSSLYVYSYVYKVSHGQEMSCHKWCTDGLNLMHQGNCVPVPAKTQGPPPISALEQKEIIIIIIQICNQNPSRGKVANVSGLCVSMHKHIKHSRQLMRRQLAKEKMNTENIIRTDTAKAIIFI